jgi:hypothetical protein
MAGPYSGTAGSVVLVSGGTTLVGWITEWSLDKSLETVDTTSFGNNNRTRIPSIKDATGSFSGSFDDGDTAQSAIITAFENGTFVGLRLYVGTAKYFNIGSAVITGYNPTMSVDGKADISYDFESNGSSALV